MPVTTLKPEDINEALLKISDLLERSPLTFVLLKDTAQEVYDHHHDPLANLNLSCIDLGIQEKDFTRDGQSMFKTLLDMSKIEYMWTPQEIRMMVGEVPVNIKVFKRKYSFFQNPNHVFYRTAELLVPNPIDKYMKARFIIR